MFLMKKVNCKQKTNERESQGINSRVIASGGGGREVMPYLQNSHSKVGNSNKPGKPAQIFQRYYRNISNFYR